MPRLTAEQRHQMIYKKFVEVRDKYTQPITDIEVSKIIYKAWAEYVDALELEGIVNTPQGYKYRSELPQGLRKPQK